MNGIDREVRAVLFDLDDTLFDHQHSTRIGLEAVRQEYSCFRGKSLEWLERENQRVRSELHHSFVSGELSLNEARVERFHRLFSFCGETVPSKTANAALLRFRQHYLSSCRPIRGAVVLLEKLRRFVKIGVITNHVVQEQQQKLQACGFGSLVDSVVVSEEVGSVKPEAGIFEEALDRLKCGPDSAVMVGDLWETDILGAHNMGIRPIWLNRYASACPDRSIAVEINSYVPTGSVVELVLQRSEESKLECAAVI